jgi:hypothetical protein
MCRVDEDVTYLGQWGLPGSELAWPGRFVYASCTSPTPFLARAHARVTEDTPHHPLAMIIVPGPVAGEQPLAPQASDRVAPGRGRTHP